MRGRGAFALLALVVAGGCRTRLDGEPLWPMTGHDPQHRSRSRVVGPAAPAVRWSVPAALVAPPVVDARGFVYVAARESGGVVVRALAPASGAEEARLALPGLAGAELAIGPDGTIFAGGPGGPIVAIEPSLRSVLAPLACAPQGPRLVLDADGGLWASCEPDGALTAFAPRGGIAWRSSGPLDLVGIGDGRGLFGVVPPPAADAGAIVAIGRDGLTRWRVAGSFAGGALGAIGAGAADGAPLVVEAGGDGAHLVALDPATGRRRFTAALDEAPAFAPSVGWSGVAHVMLGRHVLAFRDDGRVAWIYAAELSIDRFLVSVVDGDDVVYALGVRGEGEGPLVLISFSAAGHERWREVLDPDRAQAPVGLALGDEGRLYVAGSAGLYAVGP